MRSGIVYAAVAALIAGTGWASFRGLGGTEPMVEPISLREQSARHGGGGYHRHYFVGGGIHHGK